MSRWLLSLVLISAAAAQQPAPIIGPRGVLHGATFQSLLGAPFFGSTSGLAPGALFRIDGGHLGPAELTVGTAPFGLRLPDIPGGTEVHVRSIGTGKVAQASIVFVQENQLTAILPRNFPIGDAEVRVWYQGQASEPTPVAVLFSFPGLFTLTQNGVGRAVIQNYEADGSITLNGLTRSAKPGRYVTLWATGLGDAREEDVRVYLGETFYPAEFAGPAPGLPGVDQINVRLPDDLPLRGCYVRLVVAGDGLGSGPASIAISDQGGPCEHPWGLSAERMAEIEAGDEATELMLTLIDETSDLTRTQPPPFPARSTASGEAYTYTEARLEFQAIAATRSLIPDEPSYFCSITRFISTLDPIPPLPPSPAQAAPPDQTLAGHPWLLTGPTGQSLTLAALTAPFPPNFVASDEREPGFLTPGEWTVRVPGGAKIGPLEFTVQMPPLPAIDAPTTLRRGQDLELTWTAREPSVNEEITVQVQFWQPIAGSPGAFRQDGIDCQLGSGARTARIPLSSLAADLDAATEGEVNFTYRSRQYPAGDGAADHVEARGIVSHSWAIPLQ